VAILSRGANAANTIRQNTLRRNRISNNEISVDSSRPASAMVEKDTMAPTIHSMARGTDWAGKAVMALLRVRPPGRVSRIASRRSLFGTTRHTPGGYYRQGRPAADAGRRSVGGRQR